MELTEDDFKRCNELTVDYNYAQPIICMYAKLNKQGLIKKLVCPNEVAAKELFGRLYKTWREVHDDLT